MKSTILQTWHRSERIDSTSRIIDVKYYVLLLSPSFVALLDNVQWETILRIRLYALVGLPMGR
jgi:uncharacterized alpha-E superfamily protein